MPAPNGLGLLGVDFTWIYTYNQELKFGLWIACGLFVAGVLTLPAIGYMLLLAVGIGTLRNSQGHVHHGTQLMALTILSLFIGYLICTIQNFRTKSWNFITSIVDHRYAYMCALQGIAAYYFIAGVAKIEARGFFRWISELKNFGIYVDRNGQQQYLAGGSEEAYQRSQTLASWINDHPVLTTLIIAPGLIVELAAPLLLLNRRIALLVGLSMAGLHILVGYMMQLSFPMNELIILIFVINVPFTVCWFARKAGSTIGIIDRPVKAE